MATAESIAIRREQAIRRLQAVTQALQAEVDFTRREKDPALAEVDLLERIATGLEKYQAERVQPEPIAPTAESEPPKRKK